jgi:Domain of unknown function (DUF3806)
MAAPGAGGSGAATPGIMCEDVPPEWRSASGFSSKVDPTVDQKIEPPCPEDAARVEKMRSWVRDHFTPETRDEYDSVQGKIRLLQTILDSSWIAPDETWKLQSLGITLGDILVQTMGLIWVAVEDEYGRDPALRDADTSTLVFPMTMISKRIERGETVSVTELLDWTHDTVTRLREHAEQNT